MDWFSVAAFILGLLAGFPFYLAFERWTTCKATVELLKRLEESDVIKHRGTYILDKEEDRG